MSKYDELCGMYADSRKRFFDHREACYGFTENLIQRMVEFFAVPEGQLRVVPTLDKPEPERAYTVRDALLMGHDLYWHIGIEMTLCAGETDTPKQPVLIVLGIKKEENAFWIKTSEKDKGFKIPFGDKAAQKLFYEELFHLIQSWLEATLNRYVEKKPVICRIGFMPECE